MDQICPTSKTIGFNIKKNDHHSISINVRLLQMLGFSEAGGNAWFILQMLGFSEAGGNAWFILQMLGFSEAGFIPHMHEAFG